MFFLGADFVSFGRQGWKRRTLLKPPYKSVRFRVPLRFVIRHDWARELKSSNRSLKEPSPSGRRQERLDQRSSNHVAKQLDAVFG